MQLNWGFNGTTTSPLLDDLSHAALQGNLEFITSKTGVYFNYIILLFMFIILLNIVYSY